MTLEVDPLSVRTARGHVRRTLSDAGLDDLADDAVLAVSELVTNAIVHTGSRVELRVVTDERSVRVEVEDRGLQWPSRRDYANAAGTGRGLGLVAGTVQRWGVAELADGKVVWFEVGRADGLGEPDDEPVPRQPRVGPVVRVVLRQVPLLMLVAWQEHAAALLREYLLWAMADDADVLVRHAQASEAMSLLHAQLPVPVLGDAPQALMASAVEPAVTGAEVVLEVPEPVVPHFAVLDDLLRRGLAEARAGHFLCPATQPEIEEMRHWLCAEVARQAAGSTTPTPWNARTDVRATVADQAALTEAYAGLGDTEEAILATDEDSVLVAASPAALELLGYAGADDLVGRRVVVVVPARFHQAHIAGTTMNATNGRDVLLGVPVRVPMVRADGSEVAVELTVDPTVHHGRRVFVARFRAV